MNQEVIIVRCFSCETFQTQIKKKAKKWECKMCGEKQSLKKTYGFGSGKDCRQHTQYLNEMRGKLLETEEPVKENVSTSYSNVPNALQLITPTTTESKCSPARMKTSKWDQYLESKLKLPDDDNGAGVQDHVVYSACDKSTSKINQQKFVTSTENRYTPFKLSKAIYSDQEIASVKRQYTDNYPRPIGITKTMSKLEEYKHTKCNVNISTSCANNCNQVYSENREEPATFPDVSREATRLIQSASGISVFDQDADFDSAMDF